MSQQINLLGTEAATHRIALTSATGIAAGIGGILVLTLALAIYERVQLAHVEAQARTMAKALADARARLEAGSSTPRKPDAALEAKLVELTSELKARQDVLDALKQGTVGSTRGFSEYLRAFSHQRVEGVWLTGFDISAGGAELTIAGRTLSADLVPAYLQRLNNESPMQGRQFASVTINRPPRDAGKVASAKDTPVVLPPYLEFVISSEDKSDAARLARKAVPSIARAPAATEAVVGKPPEAR